MKTGNLLVGMLCAVLMASCHGNAGGAKVTHGHEHDHELEEQEMHADESGEHAHADEIVLPAEKARAAGVVVERITPGDFHSVIPASGTILPATDDQTLIVAPVSGLVTFLRPLVEGSTVGAGEELFAVSARNLQDGDPIERAAIAYETARKEFERVSSLIGEKIVSQKEYNAAKNNYETARIAYEAVTRSRSGQGNVVKSPVSGSVTACLVQTGDYVSTGQPLARLTRNRHLYLKVDVPERYYASLDKVIAARFKPSCSERFFDTQQLNGRMLAYGRSTADAAGYVPVTFEMEADKELLPGTFAEVRLLAAPRHDVISLPVTALTEEQGVYFVYLQLDDECYRKQEVRTGASDGERVEILGGLQGGEQVVTRGAIHVKLASASNMIPAHTHNH